MIRCIVRFLGLCDDDKADPNSCCECCGNGEFTQWEKKESEWTRNPTLAERASGTTDLIEYTRTWQERCCTLCGKIQQEELEF